MIWCGLSTYYDYYTYTNMHCYIIINIDSILNEMLKKIFMIKCINTERS